MIELPAALLGGFLGSAHCVGMCGGIALTVGGRPAHFRQTLARQMLFSAGRLCTYAFLGAMAGFAGTRVARSGLPLLTLQRGFAVVAGGLMVLVGLSLMGLRPWRVRAKEERSCGGSALFRDALHAPGRSGPFIAGLATGFLPCGLVYAFLTSALASAEVARGMLLMSVFGLGTLPAMLATGCGAGLLGSGLRARFNRLAAVVVVLTGVVTIWRGWPRDGGAPCHSPVTPATLQAPA
ncbi:MAG: sulfite exporter TauE/SafE family protein [Phycisphaerales bacterium]|nr:sulfite exporter TauE/SafE family protein [Phycisphaerales bacterium]